MKSDKKHIANQEWHKDIKFNGHWYHLLSLFDNDLNKSDEYDFNDVYDVLLDDNTDLKDGGNNIFDFNKAIEKNTDGLSRVIMDDIDDIDDTYLDEDYINEWKYSKVINKDNLEYDEDKNAVVSMVLSAINKLTIGPKTHISFEIHYYIPNEQNVPFPTSRIKINKNIIGHSIEDLMFDRISKEAAQNNMKVYRNHLDGINDINQYENNKFINSQTYDIKIKYKDKLYFFEVKSGEHRKKDIVSLDNRNMRIHKNQLDNIYNMIFILCDYSIQNMNKNDVKLNHIELVDGHDILVQTKIIKENSNILEKYGLNNLFNILNESEEVGGFSQNQVKEILKNTADTLKEIEKNDKSFANKLASKIKNVYSKHGKKAFLCTCILLNVLGGHPSASMATLLSRINSGANRPAIESMYKDMLNGGLHYNLMIIQQFISNNFMEIDAEAKKQMLKEINDIVMSRNNKFRFMLISHHHKFLKEAIAELSGIISVNIKLIKIYKNKNNSNKLGKYQVLGIYESN